MTMILLRIDAFSREGRTKQKPILKTLLLAAFLSMAPVEASAASSRAAVAAQPAARSAADSVKVIGPMVGHVNDNSAEIWAYGGADPDLVVRYRRGSGTVLEAEMAAPAQDHFAARAKLVQLAADTRYDYELWDRRAGALVRAGSFRTAPDSGSPAKFTMAFSSCMNWKLHPEQPAWKSMLASSPSFHLLIGDNVYTDTVDREIIWSHHLRQRQVKDFAGVLANTPTYATWDDHDYGRDNSDATLPGKDSSLKAFKEVWANPSAGLPGVPGVFFGFSWGNVDFFMLDQRYHRTPNLAPDDGTKTMLGAAQLKWLKDGLLRSKAAFKVVVGASTINLSEDKDDWQSFQAEYRDLMDFLKVNDIRGFLYLSGDIHSRQFRAHYASRSGGYMFWEVISSSVAARKQPMDAGGTKDGFAVLEFNTLAKDPEVHVSLVEEDGEKVLSRTLVASEMRPDTLPPNLQILPKSSAFIGRMRIEAKTDKPSQIFYTLDGAKPDRESLPFAGYVEIDSTKTVRFMAVDRVGYVSDVVTETYELRPEYSTSTALNPGVPNSFFEIDITRGGKLRAEVFDLGGKLKQGVFDGMVYPGKPYRIRLGMRNLESGLYFLTLRYEGKHLVKRFYCLSGALPMNIEVLIKSDAAVKKPPAPAVWDFN